MQAAVRGHLVRRQAVGTLRCVQAIIRLQALVRARRAHMFLKKLDEQEDEKFHMDMQSPAILVMIIYVLTIYSCLIAFLMPYCHIG